MPEDRADPMSGAVMAVLFALWLLAGTLDFHFHRRADIAHTSGLRESVLHGLQLALIGAGVLAWLALADTWGLAAVLGVLAAAHAVVGYLDTASADGRRRISPAEQHVHSILDMAPWMFLGWIVWRSQAQWTLAWQPAPPSLWSAGLVSATLIVGAPWLYELMLCVRATRNRTS